MGGFVERGGASGCLSSLESVEDDPNEKESWDSKP